MPRSKKRPPFSLTALIEQTAQLLRNSLKAPKEKGRLSISNRIEQIAFLLRSESKKRKTRKKKKH